MTETVLATRDLTVAYPTSRDLTPVVRGVDLTVERGRTRVLLGESGSGKSVTLRSIAGLCRDEGAKVGGSVALSGREMQTLSAAERKTVRGSEIGFVFQEPMTALDPIFPVGEQIAETIVRNRGTSWAAGMKRARELFDLVQIPSAERRLAAYPFELSGGLRQRVMTAMAMACDPKLLLADEPTTALDATVQIQILLLLREIQKERGTAIVFVTHDLGVAAEIADEVSVMYAGRIVEDGPATEVLLDPQHPYTRALTRCVVRGSYRDGSLGELAGVPPDLAALPSGCSFAPRCPEAFGDCSQIDPMQRLCGPSHHVACIRVPEREVIRTPNAVAGSNVH